MAYPRSHYASRGGGLDLGGLVAALYNAGLFGETYEVKAAKELEELQQKGPQKLQEGKQAFEKANKAEEQRGLLNAFTSLKRKNITTPQNYGGIGLTGQVPPTQESPFDIPLVGTTPEEQGEVVRNIFGQQRIQAGGLLSGGPEANLAANTANFNNQLLSRGAPNAFAIADAEAKRKLALASDPELTQNLLKGERFSALNKGARSIPEGTVDVYAEGYRQNPSPTQALIPNIIGYDKAGNPFYGEPSKVQQPGQYTEVGVGRIPIPRVSPFASSEPRYNAGPSDSSFTASPSGSPSRAGMLNRTYTIPKKSTTPTPVLPPKPAGQPERDLRGQIMDRAVNLDIGGLFEVLDRLIKSGMTFPQ